MELLIGLLLAALTLVGVILQITYAQVSLKELKRRSQAGDKAAEAMHKAAVYGISLRAILWAWIVFAAAGFCLFAAGHWSGWLAILTSVLLVMAAFVWLPNLDLKGLGMRLAALAGPVLAWKLQYLHGPIDWVHHRLHKYVPPATHNGIFDKEDLLELINSQNTQLDNRIPEAELELVFQALTFGDKLISDYLKPRRAVKSVSIGDAIGPILMDELHKSGQSRIPVYDGKKDNIVGTLFLRDCIGTKASATVKDVMQPKVTFVHEDQGLRDALQAIMHTHHHLLLVVNDKEEYVGIITIEDILEQIIGKSFVDEFDQYQDRRAVVRRAAKQPASEEAPSEVSTEVIE